MDWLSYFFVSLPESLMMFMVAFILFAMKLSTRWWKVIIAGLISSILGFMAFEFIAVGILRIVLLVVTHTLLFKYLFKISLKYAIMMTFISASFVLCMQMIVGLLLISLANVNPDAFTESLPIKLVMSAGSLIVAWGSAIILKKFSVQFKIRELREY